MAIDIHSLALPDIKFKVLLSDGVGNSTTNWFAIAVNLQNLFRSAYTFECVEKATAIITSGKVTGIRIINPGAGYTTAPTVSVAGYGDVRVEPSIGFSKDFGTNGRLTSLTVVESN